MLAFLDRTLKLWHVALAAVTAIAWFAFIIIAGQLALPAVSLFRCPIGFCATGYSANSVTLVLRTLGAEGRAFLLETMLPLDRGTPILVLFAFVIGYIWLTRPHAIWSVPLEPSHRYMLLVVPTFYCLADYGENWAFEQMLRTFPQISYRSVLRASILTSVKSQLLAASLGIALALVVAAWVTAKRIQKD